MFVYLLNLLLQVSYRQHHFLIGCSIPAAAVASDESKAGCAL
jgi:hypothetical protein